MFQYWITRTFVYILVNALVLQPIVDCQLSTVGRITGRIVHKSNVVLRYYTHCKYLLFSQSLKHFANESLIKIVLMKTSNPSKSIFRKRKTPNLLTVNNQSNEITGKQVAIFLWKISIRMKYCRKISQRLLSIISETRFRC